MQHIQAKAIKMRRAMISEDLDLSDDDFLAISRSLPEDYTVTKVLGHGCYGVVVKCRKQGSGEEVAIKMPLQHLLGKEALMSRALMQWNLDNANIIKYYGEIYRNGIMSLEFEVLDISLLSYLQNNARMRLNDIRTVIQQLAVAFGGLKKAGVIHTDVKLDNIMFVDHINQPFKVKLIDFGLAVYSALARTGNQFTPIQYRAPEVVLQLPLSEAIDIWSLGCVMGAMVFYRLLFPSASEYGVLKRITNLLGPPPQHLINASLAPNKYFKKDGDLWVMKTYEEVYKGTSSSEEEFFTTSTLDYMKMLRLENDNPLEADDRRECIELMKAMLTWDAKDRITPEEILNHPFITRSYATRSAHPSDDTSNEELPPGAILVKPAAPENQQTVGNQQEDPVRDTADHPEVPPGIVLVRPASPENRMCLSGPITDPTGDLTVDPVRDPDDPPELPPGVILVKPSKPAERQPVELPIDDPAGESVDTLQEESTAVKGSSTYDNSAGVPSELEPLEDQMATNKTRGKDKKKNCFRRFWSWVTKKVDSIWFQDTGRVNEVFLFQSRKAGN